MAKKISVNKTDEIDKTPKINNTTLSAAHRVKAVLQIPAVRTGSA